MGIQVLFFGKLADMTATDVLAMDNISDTDVLIQALNNQFPGLANEKFLIAVNNQVIKEKTGIGAGAKVALLPPFSGG